MSSGLNITEHNYPRLYYPQYGPRRADDAWWLDKDHQITSDPAKVYLFATRADALRYAWRKGWPEHDTYIREIHLNYLIRYQDGPIWQKWRYFRDIEPAKVGWQALPQELAESSLKDRVWQLIFVPTGEVEKEWRPDNV